MVRACSTSLRKPGWKLRLARPSSEFRVYGRLHGQRPEYRLWESVISQYRKLGSGIDYCFAFVPFDEKGLPSGTYETFADGFPGVEEFTNTRDARYRPGGVAVGRSIPCGHQSGASITLGVPGER